MSHLQTAFAGGRYQTWVDFDTGNLTSSRRVDTQQIAVATSHVQDPITGTDVLRQEAAALNRWRQTRIALKVHVVTKFGSAFTARNVSGGTCLARLRHLQNSS
ncbi:MAG: hypothetical protein R3B90_05515 [Planctomycetaceae bacterium]